MSDKYNIESLIKTPVAKFLIEISFPERFVKSGIYQLHDKPTQQPYRKFVKHKDNDKNKNYTDRIICWLITAMQLFPIQFSNN